MFKTHYNSKLDFYSSINYPALRNELLKTVQNIKTTKRIKKKGKYNKDDLSEEKLDSYIKILEERRKLISAKIDDLWKKNKKKDDKVKAIKEKIKDLD